MQIDKGMQSVELSMVVGNRGLGTVKRLVAGSVSEGVVSLARSPVLVMRGYEAAWPPGRVVLGVDSFEEAREISATLGATREGKATR